MVEIKWQVKKCNCCFPFYCGHKKIIISNMDYEWLMMTLKYSKLIEKEMKGR